MHRLITLKSRADFLAAARGVKAVTSSMIVQARQRRDGAATCRVGYTCSKKVGGAVIRNRAKRRLRAAARGGVAELGRAGWDYVLIGRADATALLPFAQLEADLKRALELCHRRGDPEPSTSHASDMQ
ncbi:MAG: ribonuclease P protein component [Pseudomonadota bacterium]